MLSIRLDSVTIRDLISLDLIANLFFKPLLDHLAEGYRRSNNINVGAIRAREGLNFHCDQIGVNAAELNELYGPRGFLRFKSLLPSMRV
jgi:hypothetical protein